MFKAQLILITDMSKIKPIQFQINPT